jgi:alkylhydroperoxidase family enzyme
MAAIKMVEEAEAAGRTKEVYAEIKETLGIDFVPNLYKLMGASPAYLEASWHKVKAIMIDSTRLDRMTKEIVAVAVAAVNSCDY